MGEFHCDTSDKTIKLKSKKKHLNSNSQKTSSMVVLNRHCLKIPELKQIETKIYKHVIDFN